jgi:hypothetical protein
MKGERSAHLFPKPVHAEPPTVQRQKLHTMMKQDLEKKNKMSTYSNDMDSLRFAALCRGEDFRVSLFNHFTMIFTNYNQAIFAKSNGVMESNGKCPFPPIFPFLLFYFYHLCKVVSSK